MWARVTMCVRAEGGGDLCLQLLIEVLLLCFFLSFAAVSAWCDHRVRPMDGLQRHWYNGHRLSTF